MFFFLDIDITDDVINLFNVIIYLEEQMSEIFAYTFEKEMSLLKSPEIIMMALLEKIEKEMDSEVSVIKNLKQFLETKIILLIL